MKETLEEAAERLYPINNTGSMFMPSRNDINNLYKQKGFINGAKWQSERMYSEEEVFKFFEKYREDFSIHRNMQVLESQFTKWFSQFKKQK